ncbi:hypothetical protein RCS94_10785 [Orbaceae bacterium ac157xtp]
MSKRKKNKAKSINDIHNSQATPSNNLQPEDKLIDIGNMLTYKNDCYCEVVRPTYEPYSLTSFILLCIIIFITNIVIANTTDSVGAIFIFLVPILVIFIILICYMIDYSISSKSTQNYYQPIVFNRKQQKVYIYTQNYNDAEPTIEILDMVELKPTLYIYNYSSSRRMSSKEMTREHFVTSLDIYNSKYQKFTLFQHFYSTFSPFTKITEDRLLEKEGRKLRGYWNWCEAYMQYKDELLPEPKISQKSRADWPEHIRQQFTECDNN